MTQTQTVTVTATSVSTSSDALVTPASFDLSFLDACADNSLVNIAPTVQSSPSANRYDGDQITFTYNQPFTVSPSWCEMTVTYTGVTGPSEYLQRKDLDSNNEINWSFNGDDYKNGLTPGTYIYTYQV